MLRSLVALALVLATPAFAQTYDRPEIIRGLCRPDGCDEFAILAVSPLIKGGEGTLLQTRVKTFHASSSGRRELSEENGYVYCSRTKPAIVAEKNGRTMAFYLAPFSTKESRETIRQNANFHACTSASAMAWRQAGRRSGICPVSLRNSATGLRCLSRSPWP
jgi:hypothetical protein